MNAFFLCRTDLEIQPKSIQNTSRGYPQEGPERSKTPKDTQERRKRPPETAKKRL